jgi:arsenate reductase
MTRRCRVVFRLIPSAFADRLTLMTITLYGIPNCDTVKKARTWLTDHKHDFTFHDFKKQGLTRELVEGWLKDIDWATLVNRKGLTWRNLPDERKAAIVDNDSAIALMLENPSVIKRPVLQGVGATSVGFSPDQYATRFGAAE